MGHTTDRKLVNKYKNNRGHQLVARSSNSNFTINEITTHWLMTDLSKTFFFPPVRSFIFSTDVNNFAIYQGQVWILFWTHWGKFSQFFHLESWILSRVPQCVWLSCNYCLHYLPLLFLIWTLGIWNEHDKSRINLCLQLLRESKIH